MYKDALGDNGTWSAFCLFYVNDKHFNELKNLDFNYEVPTDPLDTPNLYSKHV